MSIKVKICGITDAETMAKANQVGAFFAGLVFFPPSPRCVSVDEAVLLSKEAGNMKLVGVFVDPDDERIEEVLDKIPLALIQLHGHESPGRVREIKEKFNIPIIKSISVASETDFGMADKYEGIADIVLFDSAPHADDILPGGNARPFDHSFFNGREFHFPWGLSGGLNIGNLESAISLTGAKMVDVSSGVEQKPGKKDPGMIEAFVEKAHAL